MPPRSDDFWHARHTCGHAVFWNDPETAVRASTARCPWCGAETGQKVPQNVEVLGDPNGSVLAFRKMLPDGRVPSLSKRPGKATLHHLEAVMNCRAVKPRLVST